MNCLECRELLQRRMDGESVATEALESHLSQCTACREQHAGALRLLEAMKKLPAPQLPVSFPQSMVAKVMHDRWQRGRRTQRRVFVTVALAASVLVVLLLAYNWLPRIGNHGPNGPIAVEGPKKDIPLKMPEAPKELPKPETPGPFAKLTDRVADSTRDHAKVVLVAANLDGMGKLPPVGELPEAGQEVTDGVRTVTRSARKAFDFLVRELPMPEIGEQP